ncbi:DNA (cytosine-5)-methyltransferase 3C-like [Watersipora subatra]|uniref:DNA (cytosine-5)-methyltransferase 3C-like n=1 Tax=Watersipora subatra TaxID=2589382 RepID=UPI00355C1EA0
MADSWSSTRKHCNDSSNRTCNVNKPAEDSLNETLMVPDSTTELLSISSPSSPLDLNLMIAEQPHKSISLSADGMTKDNLSKKTLSQLPLGEASFTSPVMLSPLNLHCRPAQTSPISPNEQRRPSQTSPNLYRALTRKLPPPDDSIKTLEHPEEKLTSVDTSMDSLSEVHIVEQACEENESESEKFREAFPASSAVSKLSVEDSKVEQKPKSQECSLAPLSPCESPPEPPREADTAIISRRRRVCQTDFFRVVYPEPKRKKCVDPGRPVLKTKTSKEQRVTTPAQLKLCKDKTNVPAVDILKPSADSAQNLKALANSSQSSAGLDEKSPKNQEEKMDGKTVGRIVWAKLTARSKAWPAVTIKNTLAAQSPASADSQWVFWYGEHKVSEVQINRLHDFDVGFKNSFKSNSGSVYQSAVIEALRDCWTQLNTNNDRPSAETMPDGLEALVEWADERFCSDVSILSDGEVPKEVGERLVEIVAMINEAEDSADESDDGTDQDYRIKQRNLTPKSKKEAAERKVALVSRATMMAQVKSEGIDLESVCLSCGNQVSSSQNEHPLFRGGVCKACMYHVKDSFFSFGSDGCMSYCVICGHGGELLVCDSQTCGRTYCNECIEVLGSEQLLEDVKESDPWACFVCKPMSREGVLIHRRDDWKQRLMKFYQKPSKLHNLPECKPDRKLRVISLFDGIGTAKVVLDNLNLDVEVYYSLEIEEAAIQVVNLNHGDSIIQLGDIREFTEEKLASLGRIDLLVGGSPCNDLALVNPARKGLYDATGTGILFFDFYRVLMTLMSRQPNHSVLWLFENVVHMNKETKEAISRFLECEPVKLDAGVFSAQSRARYFWGNIPGMFCPISPEMSSANIRLQDVLSKGREAAVSKIRTVTTRGASLLQGKNEDTHAVVMNGQSDKLWPTELEKVFGLPVHYTDAGNLAPGKRQKLLGRSWCVPVIEHLLKPLTHLFAVKPDKSNKESCTCGKK